MPQIIECRIQGYCGGVQNAIDKVQKLRSENPDLKITVLGSLVHNRYVNDMLKKQNIEILEAKDKTRLELLDEIRDGAVVFTAHGVSDSVRQKAAEKNLQVLDASCPFVLATQKQIAKRMEQGFALFYIGKKGHPEAEAAISDIKDAWLIETEDDIPLDISLPVFVTNQTTMSRLDLESLFEKISSLYPQAQFLDELCSATRKRQDAVLELKDQNVDALVVVGDPHSNNTRKLAQVANAAGISLVQSVENAEQLDLSALSSCKKIAVTSGASTPAFLKDAVVQALSSIK
jgi:4-hydroxy-3-methylbut-2-enyl diphosphate reductase